MKGVTNESHMAPRKPSRNFLFVSVTRRHWELLCQLTTRDILGRYRGSYLGLAWSALTPILMLLVYTIIFSQVFKARWGTTAEADDPANFAINLFVGLLVFNLFAECANRAPTLITGNPNYVKKIIFPLEVLAEMCVGSALFHTLIGTIILLVATTGLNKTIHLTALLLPVIWLPLVLGCLAVTLILAASGVFIRDIGQFTSVGVSMLMFLSPVFYPPTAVPKGLQWLINVNPLASVIDHTRAILITGSAPEATTIGLELLASAVLCEASFRIFKKVKPYFGDAI